MHKTPITNNTSSCSSISYLLSRIYIVDVKTQNGRKTKNESSIDLRSNFVIFSSIIIFRYIAVKFRTTLYILIVYRPRQHSCFTFTTLQGQYRHSCKDSSTTFCSLGFGFLGGYVRKLFQFLMFGQFPDILLQVLIKSHEFIFLSLIFIQNKNIVYICWKT